MRIEQIESFIQISQFKSLSSASEEMHISHQALNASIQKMEAELDFPLLIRNSKGITLTEEGRLFAKGATKLLAEYYTLLSQIRGDRFQYSGSVRIGIYYGLLEAFFSNVLAKFYKECPTIQLSTIEMPSDQLLDDLNKKNIDFGIISHSSYENPDWLSNPDYIFTPFYTCKLYARISANSPLSQFKSISLKTLLKEKILIYQPKGWGCSVNPTCYMIEQVCPTCSLDIETNFQLHQKKLAEGLGVAFGLPYSNEYSKDIKLIPIKDNISFTCGILSLNTEHLPGIQYIMNYLTLLVDNY